MTDIHELGAVDLARALRHGELSVRDAVNHTLERAESIGPLVGAFVTLTPELAHRQAQTADDAIAEARRAGTLAELPPLLGVPCPIKDLNAVAGVPMSAGSKALQGFIPDYDDGITHLLRNAGTIMIGKTNTPEFGLPCYTEPDVAPPARTPWDLTRSAGGSSGGAAAAVSARFVPIAHGSDGGGSIRIPASTCGLVGLKPSRGLVSAGPVGVDGPGLASHGVLTRCVADTAAGLDALSSGWPGDSMPRPSLPHGGFLASLAASPMRLRVGILTEPMIVDDARVDSSCLAAVNSTIEILESLGHEVIPATRPFGEAEWAPFMPLWAVGALSIPIPPDAEHTLRPLTRWLRETGRTFTGLEYSQAVTRVQQLSRTVAMEWDKYDVVLTPTLAQPPALIGSLRNDDNPALDFDNQCRFTPWTSIYNLTGRPAISLPLGWSATDGGGPLPIGVTFGAALGQDALLLSLAAQIEDVIGQFPVA